MKRHVLAVCAIALAGASALSACSVSVTSHDAPAEEASAGASAAPDASQAAQISQEVFSFCSLEARGSVDFISLLGADAGSAIKDGIDTSISQQQLAGPDVDACIKGWIDTLALNGLTYDAATQSVTGELTATSSDDAKLPEGVMDNTGSETGPAGE